MHGPFCHKTWSVLSLTWSVLSCGGPFCPWSVLSMVRYVPNSAKTWYRPHGNFHTMASKFRTLPHSRYIPPGYTYLFLSALVSVNYQNIFTLCLVMSYLCQRNVSSTSKLYTMDQFSTSNYTMCAAVTLDHHSRVLTWCQSPIREFFLLNIPSLLHTANSPSILQ